MIKDKEVGVLGQGHHIDVSHLALADHIPGIGLGPFLNHRIHDRNLSRPGQCLEFCNGVLEDISPCGTHNNQDGPVFIRACNKCGLFPGDLVLQLGDEGVKGYVQAVGGNRVQELPQGSSVTRRNQVRPISRSRLTVLAYLDGVDHVQAQLGKVGKILGCEPSILEVGVDEPQSLKPSRVSLHALQRRDGDADCSSCYGIFYGTKSVDEKPDLDAGIIRNTGQLCAEFMGNNYIGWHAPPIEPLYGFCFGGLQGFGVAEDLLNGSLL